MPKSSGFSDEFRDLVYNWSEKERDLNKNCEEWMLARQEKEEILQQALPKNVTGPKSNNNPIPMNNDCDFPVISSEMTSRLESVIIGDKSKICLQQCGLSIYYNDMQTLLGSCEDEWLNDNIINCYMSLIVEQSSESGRLNVFAMSTFFYHFLSKFGYASVQRWTKRVDIFSFDIIAIPIHLPGHWAMVVVDCANTTGTYYDSMNRKMHSILKVIEQYLEDEYVDKKTSHLPFDWKFVCDETIPLQSNGNDCGVFACQYIECIARNRPITFAQVNMPYLRKKMAIEILNGKLLN